MPKNTNVIQPQIVLKDISWTFNNTFNTKDEFNTAITQYQIVIKGTSIKWTPHEIVTPLSHMSIILDRDWIEEEEEQLITLEVSNADGSPLTSLDVLYQLNNSLADYDLGDLQFFEGLEFLPDQNAYLLKLGS